MNKQIITNWFIFSLYGVLHTAIAGTLMYFAGFTFPVAPMFPEELFLLYSFIAAFFFNILDYYLYVALLKKATIPRLEKIIFFICDIAICAISSIAFLVINIYLFFARSGDLKTVSHWIWVVSFVVILICFLNMRIKAFRKFPQAENNSKPLKKKGK